MLARPALVLAIIVLAVPALAKTKCSLSATDSAGITARGRLLQEYDQAAWHATDALLATHPDKQLVVRYIAEKTAAGWVVAFGRLSDAGNQFLIAYEATQETNSQQFSVKRYDPPKQDAGFYFLGAKATATALKNFHGENRPYNTSALPAPDGRIWVYVVPAQTVDGVYPLGGDTRYLVSADGNTIVETRPLHKTIMDRDMRKPPSGGKISAGYHTHVLSDVPEDTDVFFVLRQRPPLTEYVGTQQKQIYVIQTDGSIACGQ